ncbi:FkbM family methyltransferase [Sagittula salina]|uniref:FkbM family methyltransferase n=1 Tax=Sagittula salina TaxID=2820268 RepID=A0A940MTC3_9RHOB|nr:FkbM family methyltransferase [Sagittula salina]MBP0484486.1 FkbM family methyltransferase [Sagittula salina]
MKIDVEFIEHEVLGQRVVFALDRDNHDWYFETVRKKPFRNPVHYHLPKLRSVLGEEGFRYADFGANIGTTALFAAAMGVPTLAIEAGSVNYALLLEAQRANGFGALFRPVYVAASDRIGVAQFAENSAWGALSESGKQTSRVPTAPMAQILGMNGFEAAQVIKVDIEGAELQALSGFEAIAERAGAPDLIVESNEVACTRFGYTPQALWSRLMDLGYDVWLLGGRNLTRLTPEAVQTAVVEDVLATKRPAAFLSGPLGYTLADYDAGAARARLEGLSQSASDEKTQGFVSRQMALLGSARAA